MTEPSRDRELVEKVAEEFVKRYRAGERPSIDEYVAAHPEHAAEIRELFPALLVMEELAPSDDSPGGAERAPARPSDPPLQRLGDYRILREVGRGGMGVVYEAVQESLGRRVALKVLPVHAVADPQLLARFQREARAAARLHHTNIVPVFDVGEEDGVCFFAMQLVQGQALDEVIAELRRLRSGGTGPTDPVATGPATQSLATGAFARPGGGADEITEHAARAEVAGSTLVPGHAPSSLSEVESNFRTYCHNVARLSRQAAEALAYAHASGIIHRDVKPSNLLLGTNGIVWVSDFGLAMTEERGLTETGEVVGTLRYLAPERLQGHCDARADVYALGLTTYELLTLRPAFDTEDRIRLIEHICWQEPIRPRLLDRRIPRDLETIVLKAIDKDLQRRYQSAEELAADLRRFAADEPVRARPPGPLERLWRWGHRNPVVASLTLAILGLFVVGLTTATVLYLRAHEEAQKAEQERIRAEENLNDALGAVEQYLGSVGESAELKTHGLEKLRRNLLASARDFLERFALQRRDDPRFRANLARAYHRLAVISQSLGEFDDAIRLYGQMRDAYAELARNQPNETSYRELLATSHHQLGEVYSSVGRWAEAETSYLEELRLDEELSRNNPDNAKYLLAVADAHDNLTRLCENLGKPAEVEAHFQEARRIAEDVARLQPEVVDSQRKLADLYSNMGTTYWKRGLLRDSENSLQASRKIREQLVQKESDDPRCEADLAESWLKLGKLYGDTGKRADAVAACEEAGQILGRLSRKHPFVLGYQYSWALSRLNLGAAEFKAGRWAEAEAAYREAHRLAAPLVEAQPKAIDYRSQLAKVCINVGNACYRQERFSDAETSYREARDHLAPLVRDHPEYVESQTVLGTVFSTLGSIYRVTDRYPEAETSYDEARKIFAKLAAESPKATNYRFLLASTFHNLGDLHRVTKKLGRAEAAYCQACAIFEPLLAQTPNVPEWQFALVNTLNLLGNVLIDGGRLPDAETIFRDALPVCETLVSRNPDVEPYQSRLRSLYYNHGRVLRDQGRPEAALDWFGKALERFEAAWQKRKDADSQEALQDVFRGRARALNLLGRSADALSDCDRAIQLDSGKFREPLCALRAHTLALLGEGALALTEAEEAAKSKELDGLALSQLAAAHALIAAAIAEDGKLSAAERAQRVERHASRAVELLRQGTAKGHQRIVSLAKDTDFEVLRSRTDFQELLREAPPR